MRKIYNPSDKKEVFNRYDTSIVNAELRKQIDAAMTDGKYDTAMSRAAILVETKLKNTCLKYGCMKAKSATGVTLADLAYNPTNGCMVPPYPVATRANEGAKDLFQGFFKYLRNGFSHNSIVLSTNGRNIVELLTLCEALLMIIRASKKRA